MMATPQSTYADAHGRCREIEPLIHWVERVLDVDQTASIQTTNGEANAVLRSHLQQRSRYIQVEASAPGRNDMECLTEHSRQGRAQVICEAMEFIRCLEPMRPHALRDTCVARWRTWLAEAVQSRERAAQRGRAMPAKRATG